MPRSVNGARKNALSQPSPVAEPSAVEEPEVGGQEAILLVDDNWTLQEVTRRLLIALGYRVITAPNGPAALTLLESGESFDLLFTDVVMPEGMSGHDLAAAARALQPGLKVLLTTGYIGDGMASENDGDHLLSKPYRKHGLAVAVRAALDGLAPAA